MAHGLVELVGEPVERWEEASKARALDAEAVQVAVTSAFQLAAEWRQTWGQDAPNSAKAKHPETPISLNEGIYLKSYEGSLV